MYRVTRYLSGYSRKPCPDGAESLLRSRAIGFKSSVQSLTDRDGRYRSGAGTIRRGEGAERRYAACTDGKSPFEATGRAIHLRPSHRRSSSDIGEQDVEKPETVNRKSRPQRRLF